MIIAHPIPPRFQDQPHNHRHGLQHGQRTRSDPLRSLNQHSQQERLLKLPSLLVTFSGLFWQPNCVLFPLLKRRSSSMTITNNIVTRCPINTSKFSNIPKSSFRPPIAHAVQMTTQMQTQSHYGMKNYQQSYDGGRSMEGINSPSTTSP